MSPRTHSFVPPRKSWLLRSLGAEYLLVRGADLTEADAPARVPDAVVLGHVDGWLAQASGSAWMLYEALGCERPLGLSRLGLSAEAQRLRRRLERAFLLGELVLLSHPHIRYQPLSFPEPPAEVEPEPPVREPPPRAPAPAPIDTAAQVHALVLAAQEGLPFCEECARASARRAA
jgi:hypothetical protein